MMLKEAHIYAGSTYDFYLTNHNRDSINNAGMTLISSVHYRSGYANAFWNGTADGVWRCIWFCKRR